MLAKHATIAVVAAVTLSLFTATPALAEGERSYAWPTDTAYSKASPLVVKARQRASGAFAKSDRSFGSFSKREINASGKYALDFLTMSTRIGTSWWEPSDGPLIETLRTYAGPFATEEVLRKLAAGGMVGLGKDVTKMSRSSLGKYAPAPAGICNGYIDRCTNPPGSLPLRDFRVGLAKTPGGQDGLRFSGRTGYPLYPWSEDDYSAAKIPVRYTFEVTMAPNPDRSSAAKWVVVDIKTTNGKAKAKKS